MIKLVLWTLLVLGAILGGNLILAFALNTPFTLAGVFNSIVWVTLGGLMMYVFNDNIFRRKPR